MPQKPIDCHCDSRARVDRNRDAAKGFLPQENATGKGRLNLPPEELQIDELAVEYLPSSS
jgi:hypothetical protein